MTTTTTDDDNDWLALQSKMSSILTTQKSSTTPTTQQLITTQNSHLTTLANHHTTLLQQSTQIQSALTSSINSESRALQADNRELGTHLSTIQTLTNRKEELLSINSKLGNRITTASTNIDNYQRVASTDLTSLNELELTHKKNIPKIQRELTLHVMMTNIKWDYSKCERDENVLRGEVSLNERGVL
eukprot:CAMPEP_0201690072 /NCGR_PEP_ID=MMETSP0578-20130828/3556_1 /ASSEMBLY_ACC=CAM_ASM_000663 /TAXON_ID=267565 /ORGANISM="Skeletonema grethea, Strain CCMP 1804" /LENGTH=186 /DNA_ID=CAMNT_0048174921 /DNA_START=54 /DNA_END=611 /DNA_ORIENTATION=-